MQEDHVAPQVGALVDTFREDFPKRHLALALLPPLKMNHDSGGEAEIVLRGSEEVSVDYVSLDDSPGNRGRNFRVNAKAVPCAEGRIVKTALAEMPDSEKDVREGRNARGK